MQESIRQPGKDRGPVPDYGEAAQPDEGELAARGSGHPKSHVQSVSRAWQPLQVLAGGSPEEWTVLGLARATGMDRTVAYRLLRTLADNGLVSERAGKYAVGARAATLSLAYIEQTGLRQAALPYAVDLHTGLGDTPWIVSLAIPALDCAILVERLWKPRAPLSTLLDLGARLSAGGTAIGRCFLAYGALSLPEGAARTPELAARLEEIREADGIEYSSHEVRLGISALAGTIRTSAGDAIGAICVSGAAYFAIYGVWITESYPTRIRAWALGLIFNSGRLVGGFAPVIIGGVAAGLGGLGPAMIIGVPGFALFAVAASLMRETRNVRLEDVDAELAAAGAPSVQST